MKHILTVLLLVLGTSCIHKEPTIVITKSGTYNKHYYVEGFTTSVAPISETAQLVPSNPQIKEGGYSVVIHQKDGKFKDSFTGTDQVPLAYVKFGFSQNGGKDTASVIIK